MPWSIVSSVLLLTPLLNTFWSLLWYFNKRISHIWSLYETFQCKKKMWTPVAHNRAHIRHRHWLWFRLCVEKEISKTRVHSFQPLWGLTVWTGSSAFDAYIHCFVYFLVELWGAFWSVLKPVWKTIQPYYFFLSCCIFKVSWMMTLATYILTS